MIENRRKKAAVTERLMETGMYVITATAVLLVSYFKRIVNRFSSMYVHANMQSFNAAHESHRLFAYCTHPTV
jgi:hypothetical protein